MARDGFNQEISRLAILICVCFSWSMDGWSLKQPQLMRSRADKRLRADSTGSDRVNKRRSKDNQTC